MAGRRPLFPVSLPARGGLLRVIARAQLVDAPAEGVAAADTMATLAEMAFLNIVPASC